MAADDKGLQEALMTARDVAAYLKVHVNTVKRLSDNGEIPFWRLNKRGDRRFRHADVDAYLRRMTNGR